MDKRIITSIMIIAFVIALIMRIVLNYKQKQTKAIQTTSFSDNRASSATEAMIESQVHQGGEKLVVSPDKKKAVLITSRNKRLELWVMETNGTRKKKIVQLREDEGVMSVVWSPDGKLIAFVRYNLFGHSPMTTTHVWIIRSDGSGLQKITLPKPNNRFSTISPEWKINDTLIFEALTLDDPSAVKYVYKYKTDKFERLYSEQKDEE